MENRTEIEKAGEFAAQKFGNGYHCAEAVVAAVLKAKGEEKNELISFATAFGGGMGETFTEACGVISGSMLIIGHQHGRKEQGESWSIAAGLAREILQEFVKSTGSANCGELRELFGEEEQMNRCRELVKQGVINLLTILNKRCEQEEKCLQEKLYCSSKEREVRQRREGW